MPQANSSILALDVGEARVGLAIASLAARLPRPLTTLPGGEVFFSQLGKIIERESVKALVVGLPRGLDGEDTGQTVATIAFAEALKRHFNLPVHLQDEAVTSKQAEAELKARRKPYVKGDIDALAATYILEDYLTNLSDS